LICKRISEGLHWSPTALAPETWHFRILL